MSKRHERALAEIAVLQAAAITPCRGMSVICFVDRQDIGSGFRPFHVLAVGKKWITLYYVPTLRQFKVHEKEWAQMRPVLYRPSDAYNVGYINSRMAMFDMLAIQYSKIAATAALDLFKGNLANATLAAIHRSQHAVPAADVSSDSGVLHQDDTERRDRKRRVRSSSANRGPAAPLLTPSKGARQGTNTTPLRRAKGSAK